MSAQICGFLSTDRKSSKYGQKYVPSTLEVDLLELEGFSLLMNP